MGSKISAIRRKAGLALHQAKSAAQVASMIREEMKGVSKARMRDALASDESMAELGEELAVRLSERLGREVPKEAFIEALQFNRKRAMKKESRAKRILGNKKAA